MSFRSSLGKTRGLGTAHGGTHHWWVQRLTSIALVPLIPWFAISMVSLAAVDHATAAAWLARPYNAVLTLILAVAMFHHMHLGLQVVIEDYIHSRGVKFAAIVAARFFAAILVAWTVYAVFMTALG